LAKYSWRNFWLLKVWIGGKSVKISELRDGLRKVDVEAQVTEISEPREVRSKFTGETYRVAEATISDDSGTIKLVLWNEQIEQVHVNDTVRIENGYTKSFRGEIQLNVGRYGKLTII
jgi:replication factor A1